MNLFVIIIIGFVCWVVYDQKRLAVPPLKKQKHVPTPEYLITYVDGEGNKTMREISQLVPDKESEAHFSAYCHLRNDIRTFAVFRIVDAIKIETGENVDIDLMLFGGELS